MDKILWGQRGTEAVKWQRAETVKRWPVHLGQIEVYCAKCRKRWGSGEHVCRKNEEGPILGGKIPSYPEKVGGFFKGLASSKP